MSLDCCPPLTARLYFGSCLSAPCRGGIVDALRMVGLEPVEGRESGAPTLVVLGASLDEAIESVRQHSQCGRERVLVLVHRPEPLAIEDAFRLIRAGALDVVAFGRSGDGAPQVAARVHRWREVDALMQSDPVRRQLIGSSPSWTRILRQIVEVAAFADASILITGETGTGKELVARLVHELDARKGKRDLVVLDCTTIVRELSGSEFFGHEKGAFTGAVSARNGAFALADRGTLFLDEIGDLPLPLQSELLRVVQEHTYKRLGGSGWQTTEFRLICATHRDLRVERAQGRFRSDLFYRMAGWTIELPPLRERSDDVLPLVEHFLTQCLGFAPALDAAVRQYLLRREYPGNVRELRQLVTRIACRHVGRGPITVGELDREAAGLDSGTDDWCGSAFQGSIDRALALGVGLKEIGRIAEDTAVRLAIGRESGSLQHAARLLGVTDRALQLRRASQRVSDDAKSA